MINIMGIILIVTMTPLLVLFTQLYCKTIGFCINAFKFNFESEEHEVIKIYRESEETNKKLGEGWQCR
jgi:hypothetical protein